MNPDFVNAGRAEMGDAEYLEWCQSMSRRLDLVAADLGNHTTQEIEDIRRAIVAECDASRPADDTAKLRRFANSENVQNLRRIEHLLDLGRRRDGEDSLAAMAPEERAKYERGEVEAAEAEAARLDRQLFARPAKPDDRQQPWPAGDKQFWADVRANRRNISE